MNPLPPKAMTPRDGLDWLRQALYILLGRPGPFIAAGLLPPAGAALLLSLPLWDAAPLFPGGWLTVVATVLCYGLPLTLAVGLASGLARTVDRQRSLPLRRLLTRTTLRVLAKTSLFLFALLLHAYLAVYLIQDQITPAAPLAGLPEDSPPPVPFFGVADTILGTQLKTIGGLLLVLQLLFACFVAPLHLFREIPLFDCWRLSFRAMQLNLWLVPALGLSGLGLILLASFQAFSVAAQVLALPLPVYLGAVLYVAWREVFEGGAEDREEAGAEEIA